MAELYDVTEPPLCAGHWAKLHGGSLVLEYNISHSEYERFHGHFDKLEQLAARKRKPKFLRKAAEIIALRLHEQDHINRLVGTGFGFLVETVRSRWLVSTAELLGERLHLGRQPFLPLGRIAPPGANTKEELVAHFRDRATGRRRHLLTQGLSDALHALMDNAVDGRLVSALWGLTGGQPVQVLDLLGEDETPLRSGYYSRDRNGNQVALKARHLLELFGWRHQGNVLVALGYTIEEVLEQFADESQEYNLAFDYWRTIVSDPKPVSRSLETAWWFFTFPFELFVCADLALWPPFVPPGRIVDGYRWVDINPAERFVRILQAFRELNICIHDVRQTQTLQKDGELNEILLDIQSRICRRLGWPTPDDLAERWSHYLESLQPKDSPWHALEPMIQHRLTSAIGILKLRREKPADVVQGFFTPDEYRGRVAPVWAFRQKNGKLRFAGGNGDRFDQYLAQSFLYEGTAHLFNRNRPTILGLEKEWMKEQAATIVALRLAVLARWPKADRERFTTECTSYFLEK